MARPSRILLQTTIPQVEDDWHIGRFSLLRDYLSGLRGEQGAPLFEVVARNREQPNGPDPVLSSLDSSDFDELWLFAVDTGNGLDPADCAAIGRFRKRGGGLMITRDHMDLGSSVLLARWRRRGALFSHEAPRSGRKPAAASTMSRRADAILWPNYHSGANGDFQDIRHRRAAPSRAVTAERVGRDPPFRRSSTMKARWARPRMIRPRGSSPPAKATSTGRTFNLAVAFEALRSRRRAGDRRIHLPSFRRLQLGSLDGLPELRQRSAGRWPRPCAGSPARHRDLRQTTSPIGWLVGPFSLHFRRPAVAASRTQIEARRGPCAPCSTRPSA